MSVAIKCVTKFGCLLPSPWDKCHHLSPGAGEGAGGEKAKIKGREKEKERSRACRRQSWIRRTKGKSRRRSRAWSRKTGYILLK